MRTKGKKNDAVAADTVRERIIRVARVLIDETGDFDLPMRSLAERASVSLRTPYELFGSKSAIIAEILQRDQAEYGFQLSRPTNRYRGETLFRELAGGIKFMGARQPFYRALFRATQAYSAGPETDTARGIEKEFRLWCEGAGAAGLLRPDVVPQIVAEVLTSIFSAELRHWANSTFDINLAGLRIMFGVAVVVAGLGRRSFAMEMRTKANELQSAIVAYED
jgi:AcrR family transcriptional regulator